jgi:copper(I)-binding protein
MLRSIARSSLFFALPMLLLIPVTATASDLVVANAWATIPEPHENPSAYFVIQNKGAKPRTIVGASSSRCDWIEIRRAVVKDGVMDSEKLEKMEIPAGGAVAFVPRGLSLSLIGLAALAAGDSVPIELEFADGEKLEIEAVARAR